MPLIFLVWGQYIGSVMSYQAGAMVLDETRELRDEANRLQYELSRQPVAGHATGLPSRHTLVAPTKRSINLPTRRTGQDRTSVVQGKRVSERVVLGGRRHII